MAGWNSHGEGECRKRREAEKTKYYKSARAVEHPCLTLRDQNFEIARSNMRRYDWAKSHFESMEQQSDYYADRSESWIEGMIPELTPLHVYGTFCPVCQADNTYRMVWDYQDPDRLLCFHCGATMSDQAFPELGRLEMPRSGQTMTYYMRPEEEGDRQFKTGRNAYTWAGRKIHTSYQGAIRQKKTHHMSGVARTLAIMYQMTGKDRYARVAATVLRRFAAVYPGYLLHDYWNTYMDCDPLYACELMAKDSGIGKFEVNACPDQKSRSPMKSGKLIQTFWGCGRLSCGGVMTEADYVGTLAEALDLLWDAKDENGRLFISEVHRETVVRDLICEALFTFTHWEGINNKVAGCRVGEVAFGRFLGVPKYVHKGVAGFEPYLKGFFKFDGSTAEGASYYQYAVTNVRKLPEVARGYTDPPSYRKKDRFDNLDLYASEGAYGTVLKARMLMTLPDGRHPITADAIKCGPGWPEPAWLHNVGLVRLGKAFAPFVWLDSGDEFAFFNRPARLKNASPPQVEDRFFPGWLQAIFNTGYGRMFQGDLSGTATFLMNFYEPEGHDHPDALNIAMYAEGVEVLSDLGYIGDHPLNASIRSTLKHNLVVIDEQEQLLRGVRPPGNLRLIGVSPDVKVIQADCQAYSEAEVYSRSVVMVHRGKGPAYLVDCFRVKGGKTHDYAIHGEGRMSHFPVDEKGRAIPLKKQPGVLGKDIEKLQIGEPDSIWSATWTEEEMTMRVQMISPVEQVIVGEGPGQRTQLEIGVRSDFLFARCTEGGEGNAFVTVIDHYKHHPEIAEVASLGLPEGTEGAAAVKVTRHSGSDIVIQSDSIVDGAFGEVEFTGKVAVFSRERTKRLSLFLVEGTRFESNELSVTLDGGSMEGEVASFEGSTFQSDGTISNGSALIGQFVQVEDPEQGCWTGYRIKSVQGKQIAVKDFAFNGGSRYTIPKVFSLEQESDNTFQISSTNKALVRIKCRFKRAVLERKGKRVSTLKTSTKQGVLSFEVDAQRPDDVVLRLL
jgi:hypothetical protein